MLTVDSYRARIRVKRCLLRNTTLFYYVNVHNLTILSSRRAYPAIDQRRQGGRKKCGPVQNRTGIQGFGDPYTIHCTTGPIEKNYPITIVCHPDVISGAPGGCC